MANMTCLSYIEARLAEIQAKAQHCATEGVRMSPDDKKKLMDLTRQKMVSQSYKVTIHLYQLLTKEVTSGKITEEQYKNFLQQQAAKDKKLLDFFESRGNMTEKAKITRERIAMIKKELSEM